MRSLVMLRWTVPTDRAHRSSRALIEAVITPAVRASGWLYSPETTHHVTDRGNEVWLTVVTSVDDAAYVREDLDELLMSSPSLETSDDRLLAHDAEWYRAALQGVTDVALDVIEGERAIPVTEYQAFEDPSGAVMTLAPFLAEASTSYCRMCSTYEATEEFWLAFFRRGPSADLAAAGRGLWDLAS